MIRFGIFIILIFTALFNAQAQGPAPADWELREIQIEDTQLGHINIYITQDGIDQRKPLLFLALGSGGLPIAIKVKWDEKSTTLGTVPPDQIKSFAKDFHVAFIGKPETPFCDTVVVDEFNPYHLLENYVPSNGYIKKCGMEWQVAASKKALDYLLDELDVTENQVTLMGISAGGRIVTKLAGEYEKATKLVCVVSGGLNQFYSSIINRRMDAAMGNMTHQEAQTAIDSLFAVYEKIYQEPQNINKSYYGHPYKRWGSFCSDIPLNHLVELDIPILFVNGSTDRSTPVLQTDYIKLEFLRLRKTNLTYKVFPGCDHTFYEAVLKDGKEEHVSHRKEAFDFVNSWVLNDSATIN